jgi:N6-adenosine-specific RNA methylase IME4
MFPALPPARIDPRLSSRELLAVVEQARERAVVRVQALMHVINGPESSSELLELRNWNIAAEAAINVLIRDRKTKLQAAQILAETRLRIERGIGVWLQTNINHTGGGDRRGSVSHDGTPIRDDLPEGISRNDSSRFQKIAAIPEAAFELYLSTERDACREITTKGALQLAKAVELQRMRNENHAEQTEEAAKNLNDLIAAGRRFGCIYADPPWQYTNTRSNGAAENHYRTLPTEAIAALPVRELAAGNSHCHLWTTAAFILEAFQVLAAWGFTYKGIFIWVKPTIGPGNYWRNASEYLLLGIRGTSPFLDNSIPNWILADRTAHSKKPDSVRELIERVSPGPRLELFGRLVVRGWTVWGDKVAE